MRFTRSTSAVAIALIALTGCRAPNVDATISNRTSTPITLIEVDYPSASFGTQSLAPSADYRYSFSVIGTGPLKLHYTDASGHDHTSTGPTLAEGARGPLQILVTPTDIRWQPAPTLHATPTPPADSVR
jgi:hypothetical protein